MRPDAVSILPPLPPVEGPRWREAVLLGLVLAAVFLASLKPLTNEDAFWHLAVGREIWATGHLVRSETFSFTAAGARWEDTEWLFHALVYPAWKVLGDGGLPYLIAGLATLAWALTYRCVRLAGGGAAAFALYTAALLPALETRVVLRPDLVSLSFLAVLCEGLLRWKPAAGRGDRFWMFTGLLFLAWCQFHGAWSFGLLLLGVTVAGRAFDLWRGRALTRGILLSMAAACAAPVVALFINPYGWRLPWFPLMHVLSFGKADLPHVTEWNPLPWAWVTAPLIAVALLTPLVQLLPGRRRWDVGLWCASQAGLALRWVRAMGFAVVSLAPHACREITALLQRPRWRRAGWAAALLSTLFTALPHVGRTWAEEGLSGAYPFQEVRFLTEHGVEGRVFHEYHVGGYIEWRSPHRLLTLYDGRFFPYQSVYAELQASWTSPDRLRALLDRYGVDVSLAPYPTYRLKDATAPPEAPPRGPSVRLYPRETWALVGFGDYGMIFLRRTPRFADLIAREEYTDLRPDDLEHELWAVRQGSLDAAPLRAQIGRRLEEPASPELRRRLRAALADLGAAAPSSGPSGGTP